MNDCNELLAGLAASVPSVKDRSAIEDMIAEHLEMTVVYYYYQVNAMNAAADEIGIVAEKFWDGPYAFAKAVDWNIGLRFKAALPKTFREV